MNVFEKIGIAVILSVIIYGCYIHRNDSSQNISEEVKQGAINLIGDTYKKGFNKGVDEALDAFALLRLELELTNSTNLYTHAELNDIVKKRIKYNE